MREPAGFGVFLKCHCRVPVDCEPSLAYVVGGGNHAASIDLGLEGAWGPTTNCRQKPSAFPRGAIQVLLLEDFVRNV